MQGRKSFGAFLLCPRRAQVSENEIGDDKRKMVGFGEIWLLKEEGRVVWLSSSKGELCFLVLF